MINKKNKLPSPWESPDSYREGMRHYFNTKLIHSNHQNLLIALLCRQILFDTNERLRHPRYKRGRK